MFVTARAVLVFLSFLFGALGQSAIPPSTIPNASTSSSTGLTSTSPVISGSASSSSSSSRSVSGSMSLNSTSTVPFPPLNTVSPCVSNCLATAISTVGCSSVVDVNCFCPIDRFPLTYMNCLIGSCPSESLSSAESLANQFCRLANLTTITSLSFPPVPQQTSSATSNRGSLTSMAASSAPSNGTGTNAAASSMSLGGYGFGGQGLVNGVIVMLSVILGVVVF